MKLYLLFWCQQLFLLQRVENQLQVFVSDISMWCNEVDDNLPYSNNSFFNYLSAWYFWDEQDGWIYWEFAHIRLNYIESLWLSKLWLTEISCTLIEVLEDKKVNCYKQTTQMNSIISLIFNLFLSGQWFDMRNICG